VTCIAAKQATAFLTQSGSQVPLTRYFVFVGSALLALLFLTDWYWPTNVGAVSFRDPQVDKSIIRLHSAQRWPERIVLDTSQPTIVPPPQQTAWNDIPPKPLDAQAQMQLLPSKQAVASVKSKRRAARRVQRTRVAAIPAAPHEGFSRAGNSGAKNDPRRSLDDGLGPNHQAASMQNAF
jgi:hypothetical protein